MTIPVALSIDIKEPTPPVASPSDVSEIAVSPAPTANPVEELTTVRGDPIAALPVLAAAALTLSGARPSPVPCQNVMLVRSPISSSFLIF
jgi:hypothetical protein